ncbi:MULTISPECIES: ATP synthase F0 subunit B [unclassified Desulfovibrio]|uniref:ATP synthase F0 subunit B n=1 Tax=unclassified Desulfovibrio TaxID=2593640 RepID=UPI000F5FB3D0|nr:MULTISPECIES: ATP synthase F0 subunit B [unclassified Desulfovibrio]RRD71804.1 ATPase [Desulfovibrio sp. OH1209_COT-279]RRD88017.1 ATPase [Desulfovibrio sp. OH1186_COT-070]
MLDINITFFFQLANFLIAVYILNILLIRPVRKIIKERKGVMNGMAEEAGSFEYQAEERLNNYEASLAGARQNAGLAREQGRALGAQEQQKLAGEAQQQARDILEKTRVSMQEQAKKALADLRGQTGAFSDSLARRLLKG